MALKGSVQQCVKSEIDVLKKEAVNVFKVVIYIRIDKWPKDDLTWIYSHVTLCNTFWRNMLSRLNTLLHGSLQLLLVCLGRSVRISSAK